MDYETGARVLIERGYVHHETPRRRLDSFDSRDGRNRLTYWPRGWRASGIARGTYNRVWIESVEALDHWETERARNP